ncbi:MAG TPA: aminotransferase class I/II-fold pyridoxal phosphate-dependent enzyme [Byssovorax sp.]
MSGAPFVHPSAVVDPGAELGPGARVWHFAHVSAGARVGARTSLGQGAYVAPGVRIGAGVKVQNHVSIYAGVEIEDDVFVGPSAVFTNVTTPRAAVDRRGEFVATRVRRGASIGANATVVCGCTIGAHALVGAGAVVTRDVAEHAIVVGSPARRVGWACACGERLATGPSPACARCDAVYDVTDEACVPASGDAPIPFVDVAADNAPDARELRAAFDRVLVSGRFILGDEVAAFERAVAERLGVAHAIGVSSGTDALLVALSALDVGPGDEVITPAYSFFATAAAIARLGARPVFVDVDPRSFNLEPSGVIERIGPRTKAILGVHLFGRPFADEVLAAAERRAVPVVEDAAQAIGARGARGPVGALGALACFSFFPTKNLGALGDAGLVTTDRPELAARAVALRSHGAAQRHVHTELGGNFRLDALQAALLGVKLCGLDARTAARRDNAARYAAAFARAQIPPELLSTPDAREPGHVWNQYVVRTPRRDALRAHLAERGVAAEVYYPTPLHLQPAFAALGHRRGDFPEAERAAAESLALPVFPTLGAARQARVVDVIVAYLRGAARS